MRADPVQHQHDAAEASLGMFEDIAESSLLLQGASIQESCNTVLNERVPEVERTKTCEHQGQRRARNLVPLGMAVCEPFVECLAETREGVWATGDKVQVRDHESAAWMDGKVVSVRPLRVRLIGGKGAYTWNHIQPEGYTTCETPTREKRRHDAHRRRSQHTRSRLANTRHCARFRLQRESEERAKDAEKGMAQQSKPFKDQQRPCPVQTAQTSAILRPRNLEAFAKEPPAAGNEMLDVLPPVTSEAAEGSTLELAGEICPMSGDHPEAAALVSGEQLLQDAGKIGADSSKPCEASPPGWSPQTINLTCPQTAVNSKLTAPVLQEDSPQHEDREGEEILDSGALEAIETLKPCTTEIAVEETAPVFIGPGFPLAGAESKHASDPMAADVGAKAQTNSTSCAADAPTEGGFCTRRLFQILGEIGLTAPEALEKLSVLELRKLASDLGLGEPRRTDTRQELQLALMCSLWSDRAKRALPKGRHKQALELLARHRSVAGQDEAAVRALRDRLTELEINEEGALTLVRLREVFAGVGADFDALALLPVDEVRRLAKRLGLPGEKAAGIIARLKSLAWSGRAVRRSPRGLQAEKLTKLSRTRSASMPKEPDSPHSSCVLSRPHTAHPSLRESEAVSGNVHSSGGVEDFTLELPCPRFVDSQMPQRPPVSLSKARERTMIS